MSLVDVVLLPIRVGRHIAEAVLHTVTPQSPAPPSELFVVDGMPEGVPPAARRPEPALPAPAGWPFGEEFPRTCGTSRFADGALFWTDFLYDDHGATGVPVSLGKGGARHAARTSTPTDPPPATAPTSSASPSASPIPTPGGGSTGTRCSTRPSPSHYSHSTPTAQRQPPTNGRRKRASVPPASTSHCSSRPPVHG